MTGPYTPLSADDEPVVRLLHTIAVHKLRERNRADLLAELDAHGARIEDHPAGLELFVGSESVVVITEEAIALGLSMDIEHGAN